MSVLVSVLSNKFVLRRGSRRIALFLRQLVSVFLCVNYFLTLNFWQISAEPSLQVDRRRHTDSNGPTIRTNKPAPVVDIAKPNGAGVSKNYFSNFNVGRAGVVFNNSTSGGRSQLNGHVTRNANLQSKAARLILNEVTGGQRSNLRGKTEILGAKAEYVLANPYGITCDGCGFINVSRSTLSTGRAQFDDNGALSSLVVESDSGDVRIEGAGLDASNVDYFDIVSRAVNVNAQIRAKKLNMILGLNRVAYSDREVIESGQGSGGGFSLDVSALGGIRSDSITLESTEGGVGVRVAGNMAADAGNLVFTADGKLEVKSKLSSRGGKVELASRSDDVLIQDDIDAEYGLQILARKSVRNEGAVLESSRGATRVYAGAHEGDDGEIESSFEDGHIINTDGGMIGGGDYLILKAGGNIENQGGEFLADRWLEVRAGGDVVNDAGVMSGGLGYAYVEAGGKVENKGWGQIEGVQSARINSGEDGIINDHAHIFGGLSLALQSAGDIENIGIGGTAKSVQDLTAVADGDIIIDEALFAAGRRVYLQSKEGKIENRRGSIKSGESAVLIAKSGLFNVGGNILSQDVYLQTEEGDIINTGSIEVGKVDILAILLEGSGGTALSPKSKRDLHRMLVSSDDDTDDLPVSGEEIREMFASLSLELSEDELAYIEEAKGSDDTHNLTIVSGGSIRNEGGDLLADKIFLHAKGEGGLLRNTGAIDAFDSIVIIAGELEELAEDAPEDAVPSIVSNGSIENDGGHVAANSISLYAYGGSVLNKGGDIQASASERLQIVAGQDIRNLEGGTIIGGFVKLQSTEGSIELGPGGRIEALAADADAERLAGSGSYTLQLVAGASLTNAGRVTSRESMFIRGAQVENGEQEEASVVGNLAGGLFDAQGVLSISAGARESLEEDEEREPSILASGNVVNSGGTVYATKIVIDAVGGSFENIDGVIEASGSDALFVSADGDLNTENGRISSSEGRVILQADGDIYLNEADIHSSKTEALSIFSLDGDIFGGRGKISGGLVALSAHKNITIGRAGSVIAYASLDEDQDAKGQSALAISAGGNLVSHAYVSAKNGSVMLHGVGDVNLANADIGASSGVVNISAGSYERDEEGQLAKDEDDQFIVSQSGNVNISGAHVVADSVVLRAIGGDLESISSIVEAVAVDGTGSLIVDVGGGINSRDGSLHGVSSIFLRSGENEKISIDGTRVSTSDATATLSIIAGGNIDIGRTSQLSSGIVTLQSGGDIDIAHDAAVEALASKEDVRLYLASIKEAQEEDQEDQEEASFYALKVISGGELSNVGRLSSSQALLVKTAGNITNNGGEFLSETRMAMISTGGGLENIDGLIESDGSNLFIDVETYIKSEGGRISNSGNSITLRAGSEVSQDDGSTSLSGGSIAISETEIDVSAAATLTFLSGGDISIGDDTSFFAGVISFQSIEGSIAIGSGSNIEALATDSEARRLLGKEDDDEDEETDSSLITLRLSAGEGISTASDLKSRESLVMQAADVDGALNISGSNVTASGLLYATAGLINVSGATMQADTLTLSAKGKDGEGGNLSLVKSEIFALGLDNQLSIIADGNIESFNAEITGNSSVTVSAGANVLLNGSQLSSKVGEAYAGSLLVRAGENISLHGSSRVSSDVVTLASEGDVYIGYDSDLSAKASGAKARCLLDTEERGCLGSTSEVGSDDSQEGEDSALFTLRIISGGSVFNAGEVTTQEDIIIQANGGNLENIGNIQAGSQGAATLIAGSLQKDEEGNVQKDEEGNVSVAYGGSIVGSNGNISAGSVELVAYDGDLELVSASVAVSDSLSVRASGGHIYANRADLTASSGNVYVNAGGDLNLDGANLKAHSEQLMSIAIGGTMSGKGLGLSAGIMHGQVGKSIYLGEHADVRAKAEGATAKALWDEFFPAPEVSEEDENSNPVNALTLVAGGSLYNEEGILFSREGLMVRTFGSVYNYNEGDIDAWAGQVNIHAGSAEKAGSVFNSGTIKASADLSVVAFGGGDVDISGGTVRTRDSSGSLQIVAESGSIYAAGELARVIAAGDVSFIAGENLLLDDVRVRPFETDGLSDNALYLRAGYDISTSSGQLVAGVMTIYSENGDIDIGDSANLRTLATDAEARRLLGEEEDEEDNEDGPLSTLRLISAKGDVSISGDLFSGESIGIQALGGDIDYSGASIDASSSGVISISAGLEEIDDDDISTIVEVGNIRGQGGALSAGSLSVSAIGGSVDIFGSTLAASDASGYLSIRAGASIDIVSANIEGKGKNVFLQSDEDIILADADVFAAGDLSISGGVGVFIEETDINSIGNAYVLAVNSVAIMNNLNNSNNIVVENIFTAAITRQINIGGNFVVQAKKGHVVTAGFVDLDIGNDITIAAGTDVLFQDEQHINIAGNVYISAGRHAMLANADIASSSNMVSINAGGNLNLDGAELDAVNTEAVVITAGSLSGHGLDLSGGFVLMQVAGDIYLNEHTIVEGLATGADARSLVDEFYGEDVDSLTTVTIRSGGDLYNAGRVSSQEGLVLRSTNGNLTNAGQITAVDEVNVSSGNMDQYENLLGSGNIVNSGTIQGDKVSVFAYGGDIDISGGTVKTLDAENALVISAIHGSINASGASPNIDAAGDAFFSAGGKIRLDNANILLSETNKLSLQGTHGVSISHGNYVSGIMTIYSEVGAIDIGAGASLRTLAIDAEARRLLGEDNEDRPLSTLRLISAEGNISIDGNLHSDESITIQASRGDIDYSGANIEASSSGMISLSAGSSNVGPIYMAEVGNIRGHEGTLSAGSLSLSAIGGGIDISRSTLTASDALSDLSVSIFSGQGGLNADGTTIVSAGEQVFLQTDGDLSLIGAQVNTTVSGLLQINAKGDINRNSASIIGGLIQVSAGGYMHSDENSVIRAKANQTDARRIYDTDSDVITLRLSAHGGMTNSGVIAAMPSDCVGEQCNSSMSLYSAQGEINNTSSALFETSGSGIVNIIADKGNINGGGTYITTTLSVKASGKGSTVDFTDVTSITADDVYIEAKKGNVIGGQGTFDITSSFAIIQGDDLSTSGWGNILTERVILQSLEGSISFTDSIRATQTASLRAKKDISMYSVGRDEIENLYVDAGGKLTVTGEGSIGASNTLSVAASFGDIDLKTFGSYGSVTIDYNTENLHLETKDGDLINTGRDFVGYTSLFFAASGDIIDYANTYQTEGSDDDGAGSIVFKAGGSFIAEGVWDETTTSEVVYTQTCGKHGCSTEENIVEKTIQTFDNTIINASGDLRIQADDDIVFNSSDVNSEGNAYLIAGRDVIAEGGSDRGTVDEIVYTENCGKHGCNTEVSVIEKDAWSNSAEFGIGGRLYVEAGRDTLTIGSVGLDVGGDTIIDAGRDVLFKAVAIVTSETVSGSANNLQVTGTTTQRVSWEDQDSISNSSLNCSKHGCSGTRVSVEYETADIDSGGSIYLIGGRDVDRTGVNLSSSAVYNKEAAREAGQISGYLQRSEDEGTSLQDLLKEDIDVLETEITTLEGKLADTPEEEKEQIAGEIAALKGKLAGVQSIWDLGEGESAPNGATLEQEVNRLLEEENGKQAGIFVSAGRDIRAEALQAGVRSVDASCGKNYCHAAREFFNQPLNPVGGEIKVQQGLLVEDAKRDLVLTGVDVTAAEVRLTSGRDTKIQALKMQHTYYEDRHLSGYLNYEVTQHKKVKLSVDGDLYIKAGGNLDIIGLATTEEDVFDADFLDITQAEETAKDKAKRVFEDTTEDEKLTSTVAGNLVIDVGGDFIFSHVSDSVLYDERTERKSKGFLTKKMKITQDTIYDETVRSSQLRIEGTASINVKGDMLVLGSDIATGGDLRIGGLTIQRDENGQAMLNEAGTSFLIEGTNAGVNNLVVMAATEEHFKRNYEKKESCFIACWLIGKGSGFDKSKFDIIQKEANLIAEGRAIIAAREDVTLIGSHITGNEGVFIDAENINVLAAAEYSEIKELEWEWKSSLNIGGIIKAIAMVVVAVYFPYASLATHFMGPAEIASMESETTFHYESHTTWEGSSINSGSGIVHLTTDGDLNVTGSDIIAGGGIFTDIGGQTMVTSVMDTHLYKDDYEKETLSIGLSVTNPFLSSIESYGNMASGGGGGGGSSADGGHPVDRGDMGDFEHVAIKEREASHKEDSKAKTLAALGSVMKILDMGQKLSKLSEGMPSLGNPAGFNVNIHVDYSKIEQHSENYYEVARASNIYSQHGNIYLTSNGGALYIEGSNVLSEHGDVVLSGLDGVFIEAAKEEYYNLSSSDSTGFNATATVYSSGGGYGGSAGINFAEQDSQTLGYRWKNSLVSAENGKLIVNTNGNFEMRGGLAIAKDVDLSGVSGIIELETLLDKERSFIDGDRFGVSGGVGFGGDGSVSSVSAGASFGQSSGSGSRNWANFQTAIIGTNSVNAGDAGIRLIGGRIANEEDGIDKGNLIINGEVVFEDIHTYDVFNYDSFDVSGGISYSPNTAPDTGHHPPAEDNSSFSANDVGIGYETYGHDKQGIIRATLGQGDINTPSDISNLNRDISSAIEVTKYETTSGSAQITIPGDFIQSVIEGTTLDYVKDSIDGFKGRLNFVANLGDRLKGFAGNLGGGNDEGSDALEVDLNLKGIAIPGLAGLAAAGYALYVGAPMEVASAALSKGALTGGQIYSHYTRKPLELATYTYEKDGIHVQGGVDAYFGKNQIDVSATGEGEFSFDKGDLSILGTFGENQNGDASSLSFSIANEDFLQATYLPNLLADSEKGMLKSFTDRITSAAKNIELQVYGDASVESTKLTQASLDKLIGACGESCASIPLSDIDIPDFDTSKGESIYTKASVQDFDLNVKIADGKLGELIDVFQSGGTVHSLGGQAPIVDIQLGIGKVDIEQYRLTNGQHELVTPDRLTPEQIAAVTKQPLSGAIEDQTTIIPPHQSIHDGQQLLSSLSTEDRFSPELPDSLVNTAIEHTKLSITDIELNMQIDTIVNNINSFETGPGHEFTASHNHLALSGKINDVKIGSATGQFGAISVENASFNTQGIGNFALGFEDSSLSEVSLTLPKFSVTADSFGYSGESSRIFAKNLVGESKIPVTFTMGPDADGMQISPTFFSFEADEVTAQGSLGAVAFFSHGDQKVTSTFSTNTINIDKDNNINIHGDPSVGAPAISFGFDAPLMSIAGQTNTGSFEAVAGATNLSLSIDDFSDGAIVNINSKFETNYLQGTANGDTRIEADKLTGAASIGQFAFGKEEYNLSNVGFTLQAKNARMIDVSDSKNPETKFSASDVSAVVGIESLTKSADTLSFTGFNSKIEAAGDINAGDVNLHMIAQIDQGEFSGNGIKLVGVTVDGSAKNLQFDFLSADELGLNLKASEVTLGGDSKFSSKGLDGAFNASNLQSDYVSADKLSLTGKADELSVGGDSKFSGSGIEAVGYASGLQSNYLNLSADELGLNLKASEVTLGGDNKLSGKGLDGAFNASNLQSDYLSADKLSLTGKVDELSVGGDSKFSASGIEAVGYASSLKSNYLNLSADELGLNLKASEVTLGGDNKLSGKGLDGAFNASNLQSDYVSADKLSLTGKVDELSVGGDSKFSASGIEAVGYASSLKSNYLNLSADELGLNLKASEITLGGDSKFSGKGLDGAFNASNLQSDYVSADKLSLTGKVDELSVGGDSKFSGSGIEAVGYASGLQSNYLDLSADELGLNLKASEVTLDGDSKFSGKGLDGAFNASNLQSDYVSADKLSLTGKVDELSVGGDSKFSGSGIEAVGYASGLQSNYLDLSADEVGLNLKASEITLDGDSKFSGKGLDGALNASNLQSDYVSADKLSLTGKVDELSVGGDSKFSGSGIEAVGYATGLKSNYLNLSADELGLNLKASEVTLGGDNKLSGKGLDGAFNASNLQSDYVSADKLSLTGKADELSVGGDSKFSGSGIEAVGYASGLQSNYLDLSADELGLNLKASEVTLGGDNKLSGKGLDGAFNASNLQSDYLSADKLSLTGKADELSVGGDSKFSGSGIEAVGYASGLQSNYLDLSADELGLNLKASEVTLGGDNKLSGKGLDGAFNASNLQSDYVSADELSLTGKADELSVGGDSKFSGSGIEAVGYASGLQSNYLDLSADELGLNLKASEVTLGGDNKLSGKGLDGAFNASNLQSDYLSADKLSLTGKADELSVGGDSKFSGSGIEAVGYASGLQSNYLDLSADELGLNLKASEVTLGGDNKLSGKGLDGAFNASNLQSDYVSADKLSLTGKVDELSVGGDSKFSGSGIEAVGYATGLKSNYLNLSADELGLNLKASEVTLGGDNKLSGKGLDGAFNASNLQSDYVSADKLSLTGKVDELSVGGDSKFSGSGIEAVGYATGLKSNYLNLSADELGLNLKASEVTLGGDNKLSGKGLDGAFNASNLQSDYVSADKLSLTGKADELSVGGDSKFSGSGIEAVGYASGLQSNYLNLSADELGLNIKSGDITLGEDAKASGGLEANVYFSGLKSDYVSADRLGLNLKADEIAVDGNNKFSGSGIEAVGYASGLQSNYLDLSADELGLNVKADELSVGGDSEFSGSRIEASVYSSGLKSDYLSADELKLNASIGNITRANGKISIDDAVTKVAAVNATLNIENDQDTINVTAQKVEMGLSFDTFVLDEDTNIVDVGNASANLKGDGIVLDITGYDTSSSAGLKEVGYDGRRPMRLSYLSAPNGGYRPSTPGTLDGGFDSLPPKSKENRSVIIIDSINTTVQAEQLSTDLDSFGEGVGGLQADATGLETTAVWSGLKMWQKNEDGEMEQGLSLIENVGIAVNASKIGLNDGLLSLPEGMEVSAAMQKGNDILVASTHTSRAFSHDFNAKNSVFYENVGKPATDLVGSIPLVGFVPKAIVWTVAQTENLINKEDRSEGKFMAGASALWNLEADTCLNCTGEERQQFVDNTGSIQTRMVSLGRGGRREVSKFVQPRLSNELTDRLMGTFGETVSEVSSAEHDQWRKYAYWTVGGEVAKLGVDMVAGKFAGKIIGKKLGKVLNKRAARKSVNNMGKTPLSRRLELHKGRNKLAKNIGIGADWAINWSEATGADAVVDTIKGFVLEKDSPPELEPAIISGKQDNIDVDAINYATANPNREGLSQKDVIKEGQLVALNLTIQKEGGFYVEQGLEGPFIEALEKLIPGEGNNLSITSSETKGMGAGKEYVGITIDTDSFYLDAKENRQAVPQVIQLVNDLQKSGLPVIILPAESNFQYGDEFNLPSDTAPRYSVVGWNPSGEGPHMFLDDQGKTAYEPSDSSYILAHELVHAIHDLRDDEISHDKQSLERVSVNFDNGRSLKAGKEIALEEFVTMGAVKPDDLPLEEYVSTYCSSASYTENCMRAQNGAPMRLSYIVFGDDEKIVNDLKGAFEDGAKLTVKRPKYNELAQMMIDNETNTLSASAVANGDWHVNSASAVAAVDDNNLDWDSFDEIQQKSLFKENLCLSGKCDDNYIDAVTGLGRVERASLDHDAIDQSIGDFAKELNIDPNVYKTFIDVESDGRFYDKKTGLPPIRFELHEFKKNLNNDDTLKAFEKQFGAPDWSGGWKGQKMYNSESGKFEYIHVDSQQKEWDAFRKAFAIEPGAAIKSTSIGAPQVMGYNYKKLGYETPEQMFVSMNDPIGQVEVLHRFVETNPKLKKALQSHDFKTAARIYNGPGQKDHYANLLQTTYNKITADYDSVLANMEKKGELPLLVKVPKPKSFELYL